MLFAANQLGQFFLTPGIVPRDYVYTPSAGRTLVYTPPVARTPAVRTPTYTPPVARTPAVRTPVYTPPVVRTPVYRPPVERTPAVRTPVAPTPAYTPRVTPPRTPPGYTRQDSYKTLARHVLELSLKAHAGRLAALGIRNALSKPYPPVDLLYTVFDAIKRYAVNMLSGRSTPFTYQTVRREKFIVQSSSVRNGAINYMSKAMRAWGYSRSAREVVTPAPTPVYTPKMVTEVERTPIWHRLPDTPAVVATPPRVLPVERDYVYTPPVARTPVYTPPVVRTPVYTPRVTPTPPRVLPVERDYVYTPPVVRTPVYTPPVVRTPVYSPVVEPERRTPGYRAQGSYKALAKHMLELSLRANAAILVQVGIRTPLTPPPRSTMLESRVYDAVKNYALRVLHTASVPFAYQTVTGETFVVEDSSVRKMAINYMESAIRLWGYYRGTVAIETPTRTPVYTPPVARTPVYTPPVALTPPRVLPVERDYVYTPPVTPEPTPIAFPVYTPRFVWEPPVTPEPTPIAPIAFPTQESYKTLANHMLEVSLQANAAILVQVGIRTPLTPPPRPVELLYTVYDAIKEYAKNMIRTASIPFGYETVRGEKFMVRSSGIRSSALKYMEKAIRLWGYYRSAVVTPAVTPVYTPPVELPIIPEPTLLELPIIAEPTPLYTPPVELPVTPELIMVEEGKAVVWAVSYTLAEAGYPQYALSSEQRTGVSQEVFNSLVNRAGYIADQMIEQNTYSPRL